MLFELFKVLIMKAFSCCLFDNLIGNFNLPINPWMPQLYCAMNADTTIVAFLKDPDGYEIALLSKTF